MSGKVDSLKYKPVTPNILSKLEEIVGSENLSIRPEELICYARDSSIFVYKPDVVLRPRTTEEVAAILMVANENHIPVTPRSGGTSAAGSPLAVGKGILLDMSGMTKIISINIDNQMVVVEPGVLCDNLNEELAKSGFFFPPDPASSQACSIGGMVNTNASGNRTIKYGPTRDYVLWLEVVLPNGKIIETGSKTLKSVSSYDLTRLFVASEGSLGVVTKVALKVVPLPESYSTAFFIYESVDALARAALRIRRAGMVPEMLEFMSRATTKVTFNYVGIKSVPDGNFMLLDFGGVREAVGVLLEKGVTLCRQESPTYFETTVDPVYRQSLVNARKAAFPALARLKPTTVMEDCTVPPTRLPEVASSIEKIPEKIGVAGFDLGNFGHIGDGNMHPTFLFDSRIEEHRKAFLRALDILYEEIVLPVGGSVTGEHGIGLIRAKYVGIEHPSTVSLMRELKRFFDPNLILNPGKGKGGPYPIDA
ncbi:MAG: FAD-binding oxidoreductase [Nitrososphaeria archaeon]|jgi:glycolate oxidase